MEKHRWDNKYRRLEMGEIIDDDDECYRDGGVWTKTICAGRPAPDPNYTSHRLYRRKIKPAA